MKYDLTKHKDKKNLILNATYKCIYEQGVAEVSMRSIAKEAQLNQSTLHYYFKTKENLLFEFIRTLFDRFIYDLTKGYNASEPPEKKLDALCEAGKNHIEKEKEMWVVFADVWSLAIRNPAMQKIFSDRYNHLSELIESIIGEGMQKGVFNLVKKDIFAVSFLAFIEGLGLQWHMRKKSFDLKECFNIFIKNLKMIIVKKKRQKSTLG